MYQKAKPLFFRTETPMHVGSGSDLGHIDLPIQREKHTSFPNIQSSSLKGALREHIEQRVDTDAKRIGIQITFGYDDDGANGKVKSFFSDKEDKDYSGSLAFTDARLLLFSIKSYKGVFALATCPMIIDKLYKELNHVCNPNIGFKNFKFDLNDNVAVSDSNFLSIDGGGKIILEEYSFDIDKENKASELAKELAILLGVEEIKNRLVVLPDEVFRDFVVLSTEVITRTKIQNDTGTVQGGALFTEEYLPAESYMYSIVAASRVFYQNNNSKEQKVKDFSDVNISSADEVLNFFDNNRGNVAQIGGSRTLGKGIVKFLKSKS